MAEGKWQMADGKSQMANRKWQKANGGRPLKGSKEQRGEDAPGMSELSAREDQMG
jgi:hypothetical protein